MKHLRLLFFVILFATVSMASQTGPYRWSSDHQIRFVLDDPIDHPFYWWPRTLLSYPVQFDEPVELDRLVLTREGSKAKEPIQFSEIVKEDGRVRSATLNFFSDLPAGGHREFVLSVGSAGSETTAGVTETKESNAIVLNSGMVRVRIPDTQTVQGDAPGPILQLSRNGKWYGASKLTISHERIVRIEATELEHGPLFITYRLTYRTEHSGMYVATLRCVQGLEFIGLKEDMEGLAASAAGAWQITWNGLPVSYRQSSNHPYPFPTKIQDYDDYHWEPIEQRQMNTHLGVLPGIRDDGRLPFAVGVYEPWWAFSTSSFANFWSRQSSDAVGVFADKVQDWQDHDYAIWHASPKLQVQFLYKDNTLSFDYPIARGQRSTCVTLYDHHKDVETMHQLEKAAQRTKWHDGLTYSTHLVPTSYALFLQNRYGTIDLNVVKGWVLTDTVPQRPKAVFTTGRIASAVDLERHVLASDFICSLPMTGTRQNGGFGPVASREIQETWLDGFDRLNTQFTEKQRKRLTGIFLFMAYIHAGEDFMPMIPMLSGHPNFLSDAKSVPASMTVLFPHHPKAAEWADEYEKFVELNTRYHTRPEVTEWDARGGRWTENLGTYVWAFLRPALRADFVLKQYDGYERFTTPQIEQLGNWLVDSLSAPFNGESEETVNADGFDKDRHEWGVVRPGMSPRRVYPPMGAHSERRIPSRMLWYLGFSLQRYSPLTAEHLMWAARPTDQDMETLRGEIDPWDAMYKTGDNYGTNPHLRSSKYTGFGVTLRAAVDTPDEISIHLQQIDDGPNYRWGNAAEGGNGVLYFFAGGKSYSYNGTEDVGDRTDQDTDFSTNFGVWKNSTFHSIGRNVLSRPMYDLGAAQFAELVPRTGSQSYATPEYVSRSVLLAGHDYFALYDDVFNESVGHRLSWFVRNGEQFPTILLVKGVTRGKETQTTEIHTSATTGRWFDGMGDSMAIVSQRKDLEASGTPFGARVHGPGIDDLVFRNPEGIRYTEGDIHFIGTAGLVRHRQNGYALALIHGTEVAVPGFQLATDDTDLGVSAQITGGPSITGEFYAPHPASCHIRAESFPATSKLFVDGETFDATRENGWLVARLPRGLHHWEITTGLPTPPAPQILRTENQSGGALVFAKQMGGATRYRFELSGDNGKTWTKAGESDQAQIALRGLSNGVKIHVRAIAVNTAHESMPGPEYPIYVTDRPPLSPDGLKLEILKDKTVLRWGEMLGAKEYCLYRRTHGAAAFSLLYRGPATTFDDTHAENIVEYKVTATNGNGEGPASRIVDTNPAAWRNFDPRPGEPFRRTSVVKEQAGEADYYPR